MERNRYFYGKLMTVRDFDAEQTYSANKRRLLNRVLQGAGVVCGLAVTTDDDATLTIESGMALDYLGREIIVEQPLLRKLQMLEGHEKLVDCKDAWLCLDYKEESVDPVNSVGTESSGPQYNMTREGYRLYLSNEMPDYISLLRAAGRENVSILYQDDLLTLVAMMPSGVCSGEELTITVMVVKNEQTPPVQFNLEGRNAFVDSDSGKLVIDYHESPEENRKVYFVDFPIRVQALSGLTCQLFPEGAKLELELGSHHYKNFISVDASVNLFGSDQLLKKYYRGIDTLERHLDGAVLPIFLAKLELLQSAGSVYISSVTHLPFDQSVGTTAAVGGGSGGGFDENFSISTSVRNLEYWQKPDVRASWNAVNNTMLLDFGLPSPEQYDYSVSHGSVDIPLPGGVRVNSRYFSDEIPHGLGAGAVDVRLSIEFPGAKDRTALLFGNAELFRKQKGVPTPPWVEAAAIVYPEKGTMRIGIWLHDEVPGNVMKVHYFASRPGLNSSKMVADRKITVSILPEMARVNRGEQIRMKANVSGTEDTGVIWSVKEADGGSIDQNGIYQAPEVRGTYEIVATSAADRDIQTSAFVIVD